MRYSLGSTARLYFDVIVSGAGVISQSPSCAIQRVVDGKWYQASDDTWQVNKVDNLMTELDSVNLPGRYWFDFDQTLDETAGSTIYLVKMANAATPLVEYQDLEFGPMSAAMAPSVCAVQGSIYTAQGEPQQNVRVRATLVPVFSDGIGRTVLADTVVTTYSNEQGDFSLELVRGGIFRLEVDGIGYDRKVTIPDQASVLLTDL